MKVCFLITRGDPMGGANVHVRDMAAALIARGHEAIVLTGEGAPFQEALRAAGIPSQMIPSMARSISPLRDPKCLSEVVRFLKEIRPDILSAHSSKAGIIGRLATRFARVPALFTAHGWSFAEGVPPLSRNLYRMFEKVTAKLGHPIVTVCATDRVLALENGVGSEEQFHVIHNGMPEIDPALFADPSISPPRMIMVARFMPQKDHVTLLRALSTLKDLPWNLDLVGGGDDAPAKALAAELGIADRIRFLGERRDVADLLSRTQLFLLITNWEGFPRSILEAMRACLPVVATSIDGIPESVVEGETGFLVPRGDAAALSDRLRELLSSAELRTRLGQNGRSRYVEHFTFDRTFEKTFELYRKIVKGVQPSP